MTEQELGELIGQAAKNNELPQIKHVARPFSPGFLDVFLCGKEVGSFDTYYVTATENANALVFELTKRIEGCPSNVIINLESKIASLEKERDALKAANVECKEFIEGFIKDPIVGIWPRPTYCPMTQLSIRDLEQQAKGCFQSIAELKTHFLSSNDSCVRICDVNNFGVAKLKQAEALRDKGNE